MGGSLIEMNDAVMPRKVKFFSTDCYFPATRTGSARLL